jgi:hypothetical protein
MHDYWWRDASWARCKCGEYLCVVGQSPTARAESVADAALMTHAEMPESEGRES